MSNNAEEEKNNNYTLIVRKDNKVRGCGFDSFGSAELIDSVSLTIMLHCMIIMFITITKLFVLLTNILVPKTVYIRHIHV